MRSISSLVEARRRFDSNLLFLARAQIFSRYVYDTVGIDVEGDFDTRYSTGSSRDTGQFETAQGLVIGSHFTFALQDMDIDRRLVIDSCRENLAARSRDGRVAVDDLGEDTAQGFNP
jgi:hypothetical protein